MEVKKNPAHDVQRKRSTFFIIGLMLSIGSVLTAFEWKTRVPLRPPRTQMSDEMVYILPDQIALQPAEPIRPHPQHSTPLAVAPLVAVSAELEAAAVEVDLEPTESTITPAENLFTDDVDTATYFAGTAEFAPQPVGGYEQFYRFISKELKYPRVAVRQQVSGKVFVEFVVNATGVPQHVRVIRGIGSGCDEEAVRVIGLSRWEPGRQRGKPVKVKMILPIQFVIH